MTFFLRYPPLQFISGCCLLGRGAPGGASRVPGALTIALGEGVHLNFPPSGTGRVIGWWEVARSSVREGQMDQPHVIHWAGSTRGGWMGGHQDPVKVLHCRHSSSHVTYTLRSDLSVTCYIIFWKANRKQKIVLVFRSKVILQCSLGVCEFTWPRGIMITYPCTQVSTFALSNVCK